MNNIIILYDTGITLLVRGLNQAMRSVRTYLHQPHLSDRDQVIFYKRLAMMLRADMSITTALQIMTDETKLQNVARQRFISSVQHDVSSGLPLSTALRKYVSVVGQYSLNMIAIGEASGTLTTNLEYVATELKKKHELKKQIIGALVYPAIILLATVGITVFLLVAIFPKILPIFLSLKTGLPFSTRMLIALSNWLAHYGIWIFGLLGLFGVVLVMARKVPRVRYVQDMSLLKIPIFGRLSQYYNIATISRTLGLLLQNDVRITEALAITARSTVNVVYRTALETVEAQVQSGKPLAASFRAYPQLWPVLVVQMLQAGESSGNLTSSCGYVSELYEGDIRDWIKTMTVVLEPLLMVGMGLSVGFIALAIITPIYGITAQIHQ